MLCIPPDFTLESQRNGGLAWDFFQCFNWRISKEETWVFQLNALSQSFKPEQLRPCCWKDGLGTCPFLGLVVVTPFNS